MDHHHSHLTLSGLGNSSKGAYRGINVCETLKERHICCVGQARAIIRIRRNLWRKKIRKCPEIFWCTSRFFFSHLLTPLVLPVVSLQERSLEPGMITGAVVLPLYFSLSFCTIFQGCFSVCLTLMQASKINEALLSKTSFLHVWVIFACFINVLLLWEANVEIFFSPRKHKSSCWIQCWCNCPFSHSH